jgi:hypothetical protein
MKRMLTETDGFWRMTRLSAQLPGGLLNSQIDRSAESAHRKLSGSLW